MGFFATSEPFSKESGVKVMPAGPPSEISGQDGSMGFFAISWALCKDFGVFFEGAGVKVTPAGPPSEISGQDGSMGALATSQDYCKDSGPLDGDT